MALIAFGWVIAILVATYQGVHLLRTGQTYLFFLKPARGQVPQGMARRLAYAAVYLFPAVGMTAILATALAKSDVSRLRSWLAQNFDALFFALFFSVIGLLLLVQPAMMIRWTIRDRPGLADEESAVLVTRVIGVLLFGAGIHLLSFL